jgi:hypothetical protein
LGGPYTPTQTAIIVALVRAHRLHAATSRRKLDAFPNWAEIRRTRSRELIPTVLAMQSSQKRWAPPGRKLGGRVWAAYDRGPAAIFPSNIEKWSKELSHLTVRRPRKSRPLPPAPFSQPRHLVITVANGSPLASPSLVHVEDLHNSSPWLAQRRFPGLVLHVSTPTLIHLVEIIRRLDD